MADGGGRAPDRDSDWTADRAWAGSPPGSVATAPGGPGPAGRSLRRPAPAAGHLGRRRALPGGRALVGALLVAVAVVVVFGAWLSATHRSTQSWVVARRDLSAGITVRAGDLTTVAIDLPADSTGAVAYRDPSLIVGRVLDAPVPAGGLVQSGDLVPAGATPAVRPVTVSVAATDVTDLITGRPVDVLVTEGTDPTSPTLVVVRGATVLDASTGSGGLIGGQGAAQVTVGVATLAEVEAVIHAAHTGSLSLVAGERSDGSGLGPGPGAAPAPGTTAGTAAGPTPGTAAGPTPGGT